MPSFACYMHRFLAIPSIGENRVSLRFLFHLQSAMKTNVIDRLTDTSKYTGSHKERFDAEGKGRGREGNISQH
jgi:p25-alpha